MKNSIIYLKKEYFESFTFAAFNKDTLSCVEVFRVEYVNITKFNNNDEYNDKVGSMIVSGFEVTDRETFNNAFVLFSNNLNDLSKEL